MNWKLIHKDPATQPKQGTYSDWKEQIAEECFFQCVYCTIHEAQFGGITNFHIDHYRPKSKFKKLENDICNLFYACPICNRFKKDDWPDEPNLDNVSYPNPSDIDFSELFDVTSDYLVIGKYTSAKYLEVRLYLNRAQLIFERREAALVKKATTLMKLLSILIEEISVNDLVAAKEAYQTLNFIQNKIHELGEIRRKIRPYVLKDIMKNERS